MTTQCNVNEWPLIQIALNITWKQHTSTYQNTGGPNYNFLFKDCIDWTCKDKLEHIKKGSSPKIYDTVIIFDIKRTS